MFNPALVKPIIGITVSFCSSRVVTSAIRANVAPVTTFQKAQVLVGCIGIGSVVGNAASKAVLEDIEKFEEIRNAYKEAQQAK